MQSTFIVHVYTCVYALLSAQLHSLPYKHLAVEVNTLCVGKSLHSRAHAVAFFEAIKIAVLYGMYLHVHVYGS